MLNIVIIDKHPIFRKGISLVLKEYSSETNILEYFSFKEFYKDRPAKTDLVILGLNYETDFIEIKLNKSLVKHLAKTKLIICEADEKTDNLIEYLSLGMSGYLKKGYAVNELLECLVSVLGGNKYVNNQCVISHFHETLGRDATPEKTILTRRQREIANLLIKGFKTSEISQFLAIKPSTVSTIKMQIYKKVGVGNVIELKSMLEK